MNSLERRLQLGLGLALVILFGLLWLLGNHAIRGLTEEFIVSRLEHDAESLLSALILDPVRPRVRRHRISEFYSQPFSGHYYIIRIDDGLELTSRSLWDRGLSLSQVGPGDSRRSIVPGPAGQQLLVLERGFLKQGREIILAVAEDLTPLQAQRDAFRRYFGLFALGALLLLLTIQGVVVRRAVRRLEPVRHEIRELAQGTRDDLSEDVQMMAETVRKFVENEIVPQIEEIDSMKEGIMLDLFHQAGELGLLMTEIPEEYGGMGMGFLDAMYLVQISGASGSFGTAAMAHVGIGTLPLLFFGKPELKERLLPDLATGVKMAALDIVQPLSIPNNSSDMAGLLCSQVVACPP